MVCLKDHSHAGETLRMRTPCWPITIFSLLVLYLGALAIRGIVFESYIKFKKRYNQPDTGSYFMPALSLALGKGMTDPTNGRIIFWRTPGYPLFLAPFYYMHGVTTSSFDAYIPAHYKAMWVQIILCSFIPPLMVLLAFSLTESLMVAWLTGFLTAIHPGLVLSSCYVMTDGIATLLFILCLLFLSYGFVWYKGQKHEHAYWYVAYAAILFALFTWVRPMGQFLIVVMPLLFFLDMTSWAVQWRKMLLFFLLGFGLLMPWYIRNYYWTGRIFFCPMSGCMLNVFSAPKLLRRVNGQDYRTCWHEQLRKGSQEVIKEQIRVKKEGKGYVVPEHQIVGNAAWPLIQQNPGGFIYDWLVQVLKTTFDLTSSQQLARFANDTFFYDDLEEFLFDKYWLCFWAQAMPLWMRIISYAEALLSMIKWALLLIGFWTFFLNPLINSMKRASNKILWRSWRVWFWCGFIIGGTLIMTGAFGYARLRLPIDPLLIMLALMTLTYYLNSNEYAEVK